MVESRNEYHNAWSKQKNPRLTGSSHSQNAKISNTTEK